MTDGCDFDDTPRQYKTHNAEQCELHYPWHPWFGRTIWVYRKVIRRTRSVAHCGPDRIQCAKSLEIPLWMLEAASCSALRLAEDAAVDCAALQRLKALLFGGVVEDRHSSLGGADADPQNSAPTLAAGIVLSPSELIQWHKLPHDIQQETKTLLAKLLREYLGTQ